MDNYKNEGTDNFTLEYLYLEKWPSCEEALKQEETPQDEDESRGVIVIDIL